MNSSGFSGAFARGLAAVILTAGALSVSAQDYPSRPIRLLVGVAQGGTPDVVSRFFSQLMSGPLGQQVVVENKMGAGGLVAAQELVKAAPDGYTMMVMDVGQYAIGPAMRPGTYDPVKDLQPLAQATTNAVFVTVSSRLPATTMQEFVTLVKSKPGEYTYGSVGVGTIHHLFMEALMSSFGLKMTHVPYKGSAQTLVALLGGDLMIAIAGVTTMREHVNSGKVRLLAASTRERDPLAPTVPSAAEFGHPELDYAGDLGYFLPAGAPRPVVIKLADALGKAIQGPEFAARATALGTQVKYRNPEQFAELVAASYSRYQRIVKQAGIKPD